MGLERFLKDVCEHREAEYHNIDFPIYPCIRFLSFISPVHARLLNTLCNSEIWYKANNQTKLKLLQTIVPKLEFNKKTIYNNYVKKPEAEKKPKLEKQIDWVAQVFVVSKKQASEYLKNEKFLEVVKKKMK